MILLPEEDLKVSLKDDTIVIVQEMTEEQLTETYHLIEDAVDHAEGYGVNEFESEEEFRDEIKGGDFYALVAMETGDLVASIIIIQSRFYRGKTHADPFLIVKKAYRGKGVGEICLRLCVDFAKNLGYQGMYVDTFDNNKHMINVIEKMMTFKRVANLPDGGQLSNGQVVGTVIYHMNLR